MTTLTDTQLHIIHAAADQIASELNQCTEDTSPSEIIDSLVDRGLLTLADSERIEEITQ